MLTSLYSTAQKPPRRHQERYSPPSHTLTVNIFTVSSDPPLAGMCVSISDKTIILTFGALVIVLRGPEWFGAKEGGGGGRQGASLTRISWIQIIKANRIKCEKIGFALIVCSFSALIKDKRGVLDPFLNRLKSDVKMS